MHTSPPVTTPTNWRYLGPIFVAVGACLWGTETLYRVHLNHRFSADLLVFYEHLFILAVMLPVLVTQWRGILGHSRRAYVFLTFSGILGSALGGYTFTKGLGLMAPTAANLLLNVQPVFGALMAYFLLREKISRAFPLWAGLCLLVGAALSVKHVGDLWQGNTLLGMAYIVATAFCWGVSTAFGRGALLEIPPMAAAGARLLVGTLSIYILCLVQGQPPSLAEFDEILATAPAMLQGGLLSASLFKDFLLLALFAGAMPLVFYYKGLSHTPASVSAFCEMLQTVAALVVTWGVLGDALVPHQMVAAVVLLFAVIRLNAAQQAANVELADAAPTLSGAH
ncbi:MAG: DMT family transporter [Candidatus Sericytochromatia bacterium]|nr:DMT family transporter [Candidatus Sericytochromatia bacterium]